MLATASTSKDAFNLVAGSVAITLALAISYFRNYWNEKRKK
jgi:hypothetical protein